MPLVNGKFYTNPAYGLALENARLSENTRRQNAPRESQASGQDEGGRWVTINGQHILINESRQTQNPDRAQEHKFAKGHDLPRRVLPSSGQASIYADSFDGKKTANGGTFDQIGYTAALLPRARWHAVRLGTGLELTHNGSRVVVEVNDRGAGDNNPRSSRVLDLSRAAASELTGRDVNDEEEARAVGIISLDKIRVVPKNTPLGPVTR